MTDGNKKLAIQHHLMAIVGGFAGAYSIYIRGGLFANAQTVNLISLVYSIIGKDITDASLRLLALIIYLSAYALFVIIRDLTKLNEKNMAIIFDIIAILTVSFIPLSVPGIISLFPLFFALPFQWCAFSGSYGYVSSTIFSTNNTKQSVVAFCEYAIHKDKDKLRRGFFFLGSLLCFYFGVAMLILVSDIFIEKSLLLILPILGFVYLLEHSFTIRNN